MANENPGRCYNCGHETNDLDRTMTRFNGEEDCDKPMRNFAWWSCKDGKCIERMAEAWRKANP
jgi:GH24 family phage-related lysozyme (muramidase)